MCIYDLVYQTRKAFFSVVLVPEALIEPEDTSSIVTTDGDWQTITGANSWGILGNIVARRTSDVVVVARRKGE